jgi:hypothetical protein
MGFSQEAIVEYCVRRIRGWMIAGGSIEMLKNRIAEGVFGRSLAVNWGAWHRRTSPGVWPHRGPRPAKPRVAARCVSSGGGSLSRQVT